MSVHVMALVWNTTLAPHLKLVLLAYADHANDDGTSVYPGEEWMAEKTSYTPGTIRRNTRALIDDGYLEQTKRGYRGQRAEYRINVENVKAAHIATHSKGAHPDAKASHLTTESLSSDNGMGSAHATPNVREPSEEPSEPSLARPRDLLWETIIEAHGEPATKTERGKTNAAVKQLKDANVTPEEYPSLVAAFVTKHTRNNNPGPQPTLFTIVGRVGELRHFINRGPIISAGIDDVLEQRRNAELLARQEAEERMLT